MKTTFISTLNLWNSPRNAVTKLQSDLAKANTEMVTSRYDDVGLELGHRTGYDITLRHERNELDVLIDVNGFSSSRLRATQEVLDDVRGTADTLRSALVSAMTTTADPRTLEDAAKLNLNNLVASLNQSAGGQYLFAGVNTKQKPFTEYTETPAPSATKTAVDDAFKLAFGGLSQTDPGVESITAADMKAFLDGSFADLFTDPNWGKWSSASSDNIESRISTTEKVETSTNANEDAFRKIAMAYTMVSDLGLKNLRSDVRDVIFDKAVDLLGEGSFDVVNIQTTLGATEKKITEASDRMGIQKDLLDGEIGRLENVDPAEAKTRVDALTTQIQVSYSLTSQLRQLSLINYL